MKHDPFEFTAPGMKPWQRAWRIALLLAALAVCGLDLFVWRP